MAMVLVLFNVPDEELSGLDQMNYSQLEWTGASGKTTEVHAAWNLDGQNVKSRGWAELFCHQLDEFVTKAEEEEE